MNCKSISEKVQNITVEKYRKYDEYGYMQIGVRVQDGLYGAFIGRELLHKSNTWDDGEITDDELSGACALELDYIKKYKGLDGYDGNVILILGSCDGYGGTDAGEIIMESPIVLDIIR